MNSSSVPHKVVCFGEVLWDILPSGYLPGGAPMNVAYHLKKLGNNPALITKIGIDKHGENLVNLLSRSGVNTDFFQVDYDHSTGLVNANANERNEVIYDIVYPAAWDFIRWDDEFPALMEEAEVFIFGSLTSRNKSSRDTLYQLMDLAKTKVLDINLRPPHFNRAQVEFLLSQVKVLKMNINELELITGWFSHFHHLEDRIKLLQDQFHIETIIVTMGGDGALVKYKGVTYRHPGYRVQVEDTIGSGDGFLAGFVDQLLRGASIPEALAFASALGAFIATHSGACPDYALSEITDLIRTNSHQKVQTN